jgi:hypothetical protein
MEFVAPALQLLANLLQEAVEFDTQLQVRAHDRMLSRSRRSFKSSGRMVIMHVPSLRSSMSSTWS